MITGATPILAVSDVAATIAFYKDVLGFATSWMYGEPPNFGGANWGNASLMFCLQPDLASRVEGHQIWLNVEDVNHVHRLHLERGAQIISPIEDKPWGRREYTVLDPNGYHLRLGGDPAYVSPGSGEFPDGVRIERRLPSAEEHAAIAGAAFYASGPVEIGLETTWGGVVAVGPDGKALGIVRIMRDAPGWFSIWDVAVIPEWQGRQIGTEMMKEAITMVREDSPGAWVFLFTYKHQFYERLGFSRESVHMLKV